MAAAGPGHAEGLWFCACDHYGGFGNFTFGTVGAIAPSTAIDDCDASGDHCGVSVWGAADDRSFGFIGVGDSCAAGVTMIPVPAGVRIWIATGHTDMRNGMRGLALQVQEGLGRDPFLCVARDYVAAGLRMAFFHGCAVPGRHIIICFRATSGPHPLP